MKKESAGKKVAPGKLSFAPGAKTQPKPAAGKVADSIDRMVKGNSKKSNGPDGNFGLL